MTQASNIESQELQNAQFMDDAYKEGSRALFAIGALAFGVAEKTGNTPMAAASYVLLGSSAIGKYVETQAAAVVRRLKDK